MGLGHNPPGSQGLELESRPKAMPMQGPGLPLWLDLPPAVANESLSSAHSCSALPAAGGGAGEGAVPAVSCSIPPDQDRGAPPDGERTQDYLVGPMQ